MDNVYFYATNQLGMDDHIFWDSSLAFIFRQFDLMREMNEKAIGKNKPKKNGQVERSEKVETQSFKRLSAQEIAELRNKIK